MSTHNIGFYEDLTKIIFELSSNTHLISSAEGTQFKCSKCSFPIQLTQSHYLSTVSPFQLYLADF